MKTIHVNLSEPLNVGGKEITEVVVRRSTVGDEEDAMQQAINLKRGGNNVTIELCLMAKLTRLPYDTIRNMAGPEYQKLKDALNEVNGLAGETPENPMQTDGMEKDG